MYRIAAIIVAAFFIIGGSIAIPAVAANTPITYDSVVNAYTTEDFSVLEINNTTITEESIIKHPQRRLYSPRRGASGGGKW